MRDIENSTPENPYLDDCHYAQGIFLHDGVYYVVAGERLSWAYEVYVKQHPFLGKGGINNLLCSFAEEGLSFQDACLVAARLRPVDPTWLKAGRAGEDAPERLPIPGEVKEKRHDLKVIQLSYRIRPARQSRGEWWHEASFSSANPMKADVVTKTHTRNWDRSFTYLVNHVGIHYFLRVPVDVLPPDPYRPFAGPSKISEEFAQNLLREFYRGKLEVKDRLTWGFDFHPFTGFHDVDLD